jgi:spermidine synthase
MDGYIQENACSSDIVSLYPITEIVWKQKTPFADAVIAECPGLGRTLFLDNEVQSSESDEDIYHECLVHPAMSAVTVPKRVLVVGGGEGATVREVLKWTSMESVDWVDIDGDLVEACQIHLGWAPTCKTDPRVSFYPTDIREFLARTNKVYDVILIDLPDPDPEEDPADPECLQNVEFWRQIRSHSCGVIATHCGPVRRKGPSGYRWFRSVAGQAGIDFAHPYHAVIPSFQDDWGFCMTAPPTLQSLPFPVRFLTEKAFRYVFEWPFSV